MKFLNNYGEETSKLKFDFMLLNEKLISVDSGKVTAFKPERLPRKLLLKEDNLTIYDILSFFKPYLPSFSEEHFHLSEELNVGGGFQFFKYTLKRKGFGLAHHYWLKTDENDRWELSSLWHKKFDLEEDIEYLKSICKPGGDLSHIWNMIYWIDNGNFNYQVIKSSIFQQGSSFKEYMSYEILKSAGIDCLEYKPWLNSKEFRTVSPNMISKDTSILQFGDIEALVIKGFIKDKSDLDFIKDINPTKFHQMNIIDYLIDNIDRHRFNWGVLVDNKTNNIIDIAPMYDHDCALDFEGKKVYSRVQPEKTLEDAAIESLLTLGSNSIPSDVQKFIKTPYLFGEFVGDYITLSELNKIKKNILERCDNLLSVKISSNTLKDLSTSNYF